MISLAADPNNPDRLTLTQTTVLYLDRVASDVLSEEVAAAVRDTARKNLQSNKAVRREIADAATRLLLGMLGVPPADAAGTGTNGQ